MAFTDWNLSYPAVSHICNLIFLSSTFTIFEANSIPTVVEVVSLKTPLEYLVNKQDLPTLLSPIKINSNE